jgi:hypothetical protein
MKRRFTMRRLGRAALVAGILGVLTGTMSAEGTFSPTCLALEHSSFNQPPIPPPPNVVDPNSVTVDFQDPATLWPPIPLAVPEVTLISIPTDVTITNVGVAEEEDMPAALSCADRVTWLEVSLSNGDEYYLGPGAKSAEITEPGLLEIDY